MPGPVERLLESAQLRAAFERGLSIDGIRNVAGRFTLRGSDLAFEVTFVQAG